MALRPTRSQARLFAQLLAEHEPAVRRAFEAAAEDLHANVNWSRLIEQLEAGNVEGAIAALNISSAAWQQYSETLTGTYAAAGAATAAQIQQAGIGSIGTRFDMTNPRAEAWIRENVGGSIVGFSREQVLAARETIVEGYALGKGPRDIATDLAGRVQNGRRQGGILGLDAPRAARLRAVTEGMKTAEGVQSLVVRHQNGSLSLKYKVNKSTANRILAAYRKSEAVPAGQRAIGTRQYSNALLKVRAETVSRTETGNAVLSARDEEWRQVAEQEGFRTDQVRKRWRHGGGATAHHRPDHLAMNGHVVEGIDTPFEFPDGARLRFAHDPDGGAAHVINCRCATEYFVAREVS